MHRKVASPFRSHVPIGFPRADQPATASRGVPAPMSWRISNDRLWPVDVEQVSIVHMISPEHPGSSHAATIEVVGKAALGDLGAQLEGLAIDPGLDLLTVVGDRAPRQPHHRASAVKPVCLGTGNPGLPVNVVQSAQDRP